MEPDQIDKQDRVHIVGGQFAVFVGTRQLGIVYCFFIHETHVVWMADAESIFAEQVCQVEGCGSRVRPVRWDGRGTWDGRQRGVDRDLDLHVGIGSRFEAATGQKHKKRQQRGKPGR